MIRGAVPLRGIAFGKPCTASDLAREAACVVIFNAAIGAFLWSVGFGEGLAVSVLFSQCMGLSIFASVRSFLFLGGRFPPLLLVVGGLTVGSVAGAFLGALATGKAVVTPAGYGRLAQVVFFGVLFGTVIVHFFLSRERVAETQAALQEERIRNLANEKRVAEARLRLLQAQVEPHFLFNTLSSALSLTETDPRAAKGMLENLTRYLRTSLVRSRSETTTLGAELDMVQAYLEIFGIRMGARLRHAVEVAPELRERPFPPMLLQPLVENAIRHGLEPKVEGGEVRIRGEARGDSLRLTVEDTGQGFRGERSGGTGLQNVRERLASLYAERGSLVLEENEPCGVRAILEVPIG